MKKNKVQRFVVPNLTPILKLLTRQCGIGVRTDIQINRPDTVYSHIDGQSDFQQRCQDNSMGKRTLSPNDYGTIGYPYARKVNKRSWTFNSLHT